MLLLTDRPDDSQGLQSALAQVQPCAVVALEQALLFAPSNSMVVCDVAVDNMSAVELLYAALSHHRRSAAHPVLCLTRDPSQLAESHARAVGATAILPRAAPVAQLVSTVRHLMSAAAANVRRQESTRAIKANIHQAGTDLSSLLGAAHARKRLSIAALDRGASAVLAAVSQTNIRTWLDLVWSYDDTTYQHCLLVAGFTAAFAPRLGLSLSNQHLLSQAALVHDIGKAFIPYQILNKAGRLSQAETAVMRTHAAVGYDTLVKQPGFAPELLDIVRHHHEYLDGSGYPDALRGDQIAPFVRIVTICDIYAAMVERRPYKSPASSEDALAYLVDLGPKLDSSLVTVFCNLIRKG